jgi:hypothetical protein
VAAASARRQCAPSEGNHFQTRCCSFSVLNFAKRYVVRTTSRDLTVTIPGCRSSGFDEEDSPPEQICQEQRLTPAAASRAEARGPIGQDEGLKIRAENDPQIIKALDLLPKPGRWKITRSR